MSRSADLVPVPEEPVTPAVRGEPVDPGPPSEKATRAVLGVALLLGDVTRAVTERFVPSDATDVVEHDAATDNGHPSAAVVARRVGIGMAFELQRRLERAAKTTGNIAGPAISWVVATPVVRPVSERVASVLDGFYDEGAQEESRAREVATRGTSESVQLAVPVLLDAVDLEPLLEQVLDKVDIERVLMSVLDRVEIEPMLEDLLDRVALEQVLDTVMSKVAIGDVVEKVLAELDIGPIIGGVLDQVDLKPVIDKVLEEIDLPQLVQDVVGEVELSSVVMQATGGITDDLVGGVRSRSASADALVERLTARILRRRLEAGSLPPPGLPPAAEGDQEHAAPSPGNADADHHEETGA